MKCPSVRVPTPFISPEGFSFSYNLTTLPQTLNDLGDDQNFPIKEKSHRIISTKARFYFTDYNRHIAEHLSSSHVTVSDFVLLVNS